MLCAAIQCSSHPGNSIPLLHTRQGGCKADDMCNFVGRTPYLPSHAHKTHKAIAHTLSASMLPAAVYHRPHCKQDQKPARQALTRHTCQRLSSTPHHTYTYKAVTAPSITQSPQQARLPVSPQVHSTLQCYRQNQISGPCCCWFVMRPASSAAPQMRVPCVCCQESHRMLCRPAAEACR